MLDIFGILSFTYHNVGGMGGKNAHSCINRKGLVAYSDCEFGSIGFKSYASTGTSSSQKFETFYLFANFERYSFKYLLFIKKRDTENLYRCILDI